MKSNDSSPGSFPYSNSNATGIGEDAPSAREVPEWDRKPDNDRIITGYWSAPTIRSLGKELKKRRRDLRIEKRGDAPDDDPGGSDLSQVSRLAEEVARVTTELSAILDRVLERSAGETESGGPATEHEPEERTRPARFPKKKGDYGFAPQGIVEVAQAGNDAARFKGRRLVFVCPACRQRAELYAESAGRFARCPKCYSAIRAPHPRKRIAAKNMEQDMESLLRPEKFTARVPPLRQSLLSDIRIPGGVALGKAAGFAAVFAVATSVYFMGFRENSSYQPWGPDPENDLAQGDLRNRAVEVVRDFLSAEDLEEKARFVRHRESLIPVMESYYGEQPGQTTSEYLTITANAPGYYTFSEVKHPATEVAVQFKNYDIAVFLVEHLPEGDLIEWESSVGYNPVDWEELAARDEFEEEHGTFRVLAAADDYYDQRFAISEYLCVRLQSPEDNSLLAYGYIDRMSSDAKEIDFLLSAATPDRPERLMVEVRFDRESKRLRQVEITDFVQAGWRSEMVASAGPPVSGDAGH